MAKRGKTKFTESWVFDGLVPSVSFPVVASVGASVVNTTVQTQLPVSGRLKIARVVVAYTGIGAGATSFNIVVGTGAEGAATAADVVAVAGASVFTADQALTAAANTPQVFYPTNVDAIYDTGQLLTLRAVTPGGGSITNLQVVLFAAPVDPKITNDPGVPGTDF